MAWAPAAIACALLVLGTSGCVTLEEIADDDSEEEGDAREEGYTIGQKVNFTVMSSSIESSRSGNHFAESRASVTVTVIDCVATSSRTVSCVVNATGTASGSSMIDHEWRAKFDLEGASVEFGSGPQRGGSSGKGHTLSIQLNVTADEPEQEVKARIQSSTRALVGSQTVGESKASYETVVGFAIAQPGERGVRYQAPPNPMSG